jgi:predicted ATPase with chaperone activity
MSFAKTFSAQSNVLGAKIIDVEVDTSKGLNNLTIVGLGDKSVGESRDRISGAIKNSGYKSPKQCNQKVVISLAPADLKKEGPVFDLAMAVAYLLANEEIDFEPKGKIFLGELSLDGNLRKISGVLPAVAEAKKKGFTEIYLPKENAREAALISDILIYGADTLNEVITHLTLDDDGKGDDDPEFFEAKESKNRFHENRKKIKAQPKTQVESPDEENEIDFTDVVGQEPNGVWKLRPPVGTILPCMGHLARARPCSLALSPVFYHHSLLKK